MLLSCKLFEDERGKSKTQKEEKEDKGANYSKEEVEWYRCQMKEINDMLENCKQQRDVKLNEIHERMKILMKEPNEQFETKYKGSIQNMSAKEGLGKTFG